MSSARRPREHCGPLLGEQDLHLFNEGTHTRAWDKLGAHWLCLDGREGVAFAVWAPDAERVALIGDFNGWDARAHPMLRIEGAGVWQAFVPGLRPGAAYKYRVASRFAGHVADKADPFGFQHEATPRRASVVADLEYDWGDAEWLRARRERAGQPQPAAIYEVHLGSWRRSPDDPERLLGYRNLAPLLADYALEMGFTHIELLPLTEHPFYGSWGYQTTGYFAPTSRYGSPRDLMFLIDSLHRRGLGVILDWVPSHFPTDEHGLAFFDGTHLYEHADRRQGHHPDWDSLIFNYGRHEVRSFLISSALFWLERYHVDGLRVDAVASMLYLDYSRRPGEWVPNALGGRENLEAVAFLRQLNEALRERHPDAARTAEESTSWPMVTRPAHLGGLGFSSKWDLGFMHDTLAYLGLDPVYRRYHHEQITFRMMYAYGEQYVLPLSHDEVVHGKRSLLDKMAGHDRQRFASLRLLFAYMYALPGQKLLFMGGEFAQGREWDHDRSLDWHLLDEPRHAGVQAFVRDLNRFYAATPALWRRDADPLGFAWVDCHDSEHSVFSLLRRGEPEDESVLVALNFTPVARAGYRVGVPCAGFWSERLNSDARAYDGAGWGNFGGLAAQPTPAHGLAHSLELTLPGLSALFFTCLEPSAPERAASGAAPPARAAGPAAPGDEGDEG